VNLLEKNLSQLIKEHQKTKIIATLGPKTNDLKMITKLIRAGTNLFRLNFSHESLAHHMQNILHIRKAEKSIGYPIGIIADIQGPKIRIGELSSKTLELKPNQEVTFTLDESKEKHHIHLPHPEIFELSDPIKTIFLNDGKIKLKVIESSSSMIKTKTLIGGTIHSKCGFNIPDNILPYPSLTQKDIDHIQLILNYEVDYIALSFVQTEEDIKLARQYIKDQAKIIAKIERKAALQNLDRIIETADAIMVARGDLGVECTLEKVPALQKLIIQHAIQYAKPVIVATQMLESMIQHPTPTRAEVSDIATAVYDGADAVMLTSETAIGNYPIACVKKMCEIIYETEKDPIYFESLKIEHPTVVESTVGAITHSVHQITTEYPSRAIVCFSYSGATAFKVAKERPVVPILSITPSQKIARQLTLAYGTLSTIASEINSFEEMIVKARKILQDINFAKKGDKIIMTAGIPFGSSNGTNSIHILEI